MSQSLPPTSAASGAEASPGAAAPGATPVVLWCDHRGEGWGERASTLRERGLEVRLSTTLADSARLAHSAAATVAVVDRLSHQSSRELEALAQAAGHGLGVLAVVDDLAPASPWDRVQSAPATPWDVVRRSASADELALRIELLHRQVTAHRESARLRHLATHDDRTDLLRPHVFQGHLRAHFSASQRHHLHLGLLVIDLDEFGSINKLYDHTLGDEIIANVGAAIRANLRAEDVAARLGGDEFGVLLPYTRKVDAASVVLRLLEAIGAVTCTSGADGRQVRVTGSIGFETFGGADLRSVEELRLHAEEALRHAKRSGGDRGVYYRSLDAPIRRDA
jgi:diguanylate cyclase (GGDEF)-like protein